MAVRLVLSLALVICKVHSQACGPVILPPVPACPSPCLPPCPSPAPCVQIINPNPQVTTIIDNSVSNALVNALQLLLISNLIGSAVPPPINDLGPLLDSLSCPCPCPVEIIPEFHNFGFEVLPRCPCEAVIELPPCAIDFPYGLTELPSNYFAYDSIPIFGNCLDNLPHIHNGYPETICPIYGVDTISPICGLTEIITPNYYPLPDICPYYDNIPTLPVFGGLDQSLHPGYPSVFVPEVAYGPLAPSYYGGLTELVSQVPLSADVFPSVPALTCNYGYAPSCPCLRVNVDPYDPCTPSCPCLRVNVDPYEPCMCNGYGTPIYY